MLPDLLAVQFSPSLYNCCFFPQYSLMNSQYECVSQYVNFRAIIVKKKKKNLYMIKMSDESLRLKAPSKTTDAPLIC